MSRSGCLRLIDRPLIGSSSLPENARAGLRAWPDSFRRRRHADFDQRTKRFGSLRSPTSTTRRASPTSLQPLFAQIAETADVLVLCGDLTDYGLAEEARMLAKDLAQVKIPIVAVLGNHDFEADEQGEIVENPRRRRRPHARRRHVGVSRRRVRRRARLLRRLRPRRARPPGARRSSRTSSTKPCRKRSSSSRRWRG